MLSSKVCPKCGWKRPTEGAVGTLYWPPIEFNTPVGGVSRASPTTFLSYNGLLLLSTQNNELVSILLDKGEIKWRVALPKGQRATYFTLHGETVYVTVQDTHSLVEGITGGFTGKVNLENGEIEPVWLTTSYDLTSPIFVDNKVFLRTAESRILCLSDLTDPKPVWEYQCQSWWAAPLNYFGEYIIFADGDPMLEDTDVIALDKTSGKVVWTFPLQTRPSQHLVGDNRYVYIVIHNKCIVVLDVKTGHQVQEITLPKIYCKPVLAGTMLYYFARGSREDPDGYYQLHAVDTENFTPKYKKDVGARVRIPPVVEDDYIYIADEQSNIRAISTVDGNDAWSLTNAEEDVILTNLHHAGNQLLYGTYLGKVYSVTIHQPDQNEEDVTKLLEAEDFTSAAAVYALRGEFDKAAQLYVNPIGDIDRALRLFEEGNLCEKAAKLAFDNKRYSNALEYYRNTEDFKGEANTFIAMGDLEEAAKILNSHGEVLQAAQLLEQAGKLSASASLFKKAGKFADYLRLITKTAPDVSEVQSLRKEGNYEIAANWEMENKLFLAAAKDYREAEITDKELNAYKKYLEQPGIQPEPWVWQRVAKLATSQSDYLLAAIAWTNLDRLGDAGAAYQRVAEELAGKIPEDSDGFITPEHLEVAKYYQLAADAFNKEGIIDCENDCKGMVRKYKQLPKVVVLIVKTEEGLREMTRSDLTLEIQNVGYGRARDVRFSVNKDRFEVVGDSINEGFNLAVGLKRTQTINIRPNAGENGSSPLQINWSWKDHTGMEYNDKGSISVPVSREREEQPPQPINISFQTINGDLVTQKGDNINTITTVGGGPLQNTQISMTGEEVPIKPRDDTPTEYFENPIKLCPGCHLPIDINAKYCNACGTKQPEIPGK